LNIFEVPVVFFAQFFSARHPIAPAFTALHRLEEALRARDLMSMIEASWASVLIALCFYGFVPVC